MGKPRRSPRRRARGPGKVSAKAAQIAADRAAIWALADRGPITAAQARFLLETEPARQRGAHKYRAVAVVIDGHRFPSTAEGRRYEQLKVMERAGAIWRLELQPRFELHAIGENTEVVVVGEYVADFRYLERVRGVLRSVVEDVKGLALPLYKLKRKMFEAQNPDIDFREITMKGPRR